MRSVSFTARLLAASILCSLPLAALADDTAITIYSGSQPGTMESTGYLNNGNSGYAVVRQVRTVNLPSEKSITKFTDIPSAIDPTTVQFKSLTDPTGTKVGEQSYQFDLASPEKILSKYIDKKITVEKLAGGKTESIEGTLVSQAGIFITLKTADGIDTISNASSVHFPELPEGLITKPTLVWTVYTDKPGDQKAEVSYETKNITWWADYNLTYHEGKDTGSGTVDFGSWVSIINQTGAGYKDAKLKLIAGDVQRAPQAQPIFAKAMRAGMVMAEAAAAPQFQEKSFFEYHMYTLSAPVSIPDNSTKQLELIPAVADVPVEKEYVYNGSEAYSWNGGTYMDQYYGAEDTGNKKVDVFLKLRNTRENGLGVPLPAGRIRVNERDEDGALEFIGENVIDHTPKNEDVSIRLGEAFDVVGERKQVHYTLDTAHNTATEDIEVKIRNHKKAPVKVKVLENLYRATGWEIEDSSQEYTKENAHLVSFLINAEPEKEKTVRYRVRYHW